MALICLTCFCFTLLVFHTNRKNLDEYIEQVTSSTTLVIQTIKEEVSRPLKKRISSIAQHKSSLIQSFADRDKVKLQQKSLALFSILQNEYPTLSTFGWIAPDNIVFLRTHRPGKSADNILTIRPDIVEVNKTRKPVSGYNAGYIGLQFRLVQPVFYEEKYIGAIQFGLVESQLVKVIKDKLDIFSTIVVADEVFAPISEPSSNWSQIPGYHIFSYETALFTTCQEQIDWADPFAQIKYNKRVYVVRKVLDLNNFDNMTLGSIVVALDVTEKIKAARFDLYVTVIMSFLLLWSSFLILNKSYTKLIQAIVDLNHELKKSNDQLEGKVEEHSEELQLISQAIEQTSETIVITDKQGIVQYTNSAFEKLTGYTCAEINGQSTRLFKSGAQTTSFYAHMWKTILAGKIWTGPIVNKRKDGSIYDELLTISPMIGVHGDIVNFIAIKRDISEEVQLERKLQQMMKMESVGRLAGGIAHDFNNILSVINGYSDLCLMKMEDDNPYREYLNTIHESGTRAAKLTQQLLAFSRKQIVQKQIIHLNVAIQSINALLVRLLGEDIDIKINIPDTIWAIKADLSQLEQIVMNLAVNSRDAMPLGGSLLIAAQNITTRDDTQKENYSIAAGDYIRLEFSDTGQGMSQDVAAKIFEPFFTTKEQGKGTGLGLATVYGIIKQNLGWINVYSELNMGTTFTIYFPAEREYSGQDTPSMDIGQNVVKRGNETILLVEDEEQVRSLCEEVLSNLGYTVIGAQNGAEALELEESYIGPIHLLLTDVVMPLMNGSELAPLIKRKRVDVKILFMSGYTEDSIAQHGILEEGINFIHKPVSPAGLAEKVRMVLDGHSG